MRTLFGTILVAFAVATCAVGAEHCRPTGELQEKAQALANLAVKEGMQGALQFCAYKDGKCIVDVWAGTMTTNAGAAKIDGEPQEFRLGSICVAGRNAAWVRRE